MRVCFVTTFERAEQFRNEDPALKACSDVEYPIKGGQVITIPGRLRETAFEVLFGHDNERNSLPYLILDAIAACPVDIRKDLAANMFLIGGTVMAPGMTARVKAELLALLKQPLYDSLQFINDIRFHSAPAKPNLAAWLGGNCVILLAVILYICLTAISLFLGSLYGGTELAQSRSFSREAYLKTGHIPDWVNLVDNRMYGSK